MKIKLRYDDKMYCKVYYDNGKTVRSMNDAVPDESLSRPSYFVTAGDEEVKNFNIKSYYVEDIETVHGKGRRLLIRGNALGQIEKTLITELYLKYPNVAITYGTFKNLARCKLKLSNIVASYYRLDASLVDPPSLPYSFHSFQGASLKWGRTYEDIRITRDFTQDNCQWTKYPLRFSQGSGVPIIDLWTRQMGIGIAYIEPDPAPIQMHVRVESDQRVDIGIEIAAESTLRTKQSYSTPKNMTVVHSGDFFEALRSYVEIMKDRGLVMKSSPKSAYEPIWENWGYEELWTIRENYNVVPTLHELGIKWMTIDAPWYTRFGEWMPAKSRFPGGEEEFLEMVDFLHEKGFRVKLWWAPLLSVMDHDLRGIYPDMFVNDVEGKIPEVIDSPLGSIIGSDAGYSILCPAYGKFQEFVRELTLRFIRDWKIDGLKLDLMHGAPPCYNTKHKHKNPWESCKLYPNMYKIIYENAVSANPEVVVEICACGVVGDFFSFPWQNQAVTADPIGSKQVRERIKVFKALMGPRAAVNADHVELTDIYYGPECEIDRGTDFASAIGTGGVVATKFTVQTEEREGQLVDESPHKVLLTSEKRQLWKKWIRIYNEKMLSMGEYLNFYDVAYDEPETHVIRKGDKLYYSFYTPFWEGVVHLRGLENRRYLLHDYVNNLNIGFVNGEKPSISLKFRDHLLIEASPLQ